MKAATQFDSETSKAVLLDADGTTLSSLQMWAQAYGEGLAEQGFHLSEAETIEACFHFSGKDVKLRFEQIDLNKLQSFIWERVTELYDQVELYPGVQEGLCELAQAGCKLATVTSSRDELVKKVFRRHGIEELFDAVVAIEAVKNHKPHPEPVDCALNLLKLPAERSWMIGDSRVDILAGRAAGSTTVAFHPPENKKYWPTSQLFEPMPHHVVGSFRELVDLILSEK